MKTQVIIFNASHYDMGDNRGLSVRVLGDAVQTNNKIGIEISDAQVLDYNELRYLTKLHPSDFPAKFNADLSLISIKSSAGKEKTGAALSNLDFICSLDLVDRKVEFKKS